MGIHAWYGSRWYRSSKGDFATMKESPIFDEPPVPPGYVRIYEFLHGYEDIPQEEYDRQVEEMKNDPFCQILREEITKEINAEIIRKILE